MSKKGIFAGSWWVCAPLVGLLALLQACSSGGTPSYPLGGGVSGLSGAGLVLANGTDTLQVPANATSFTFAAPLPRGSTYAVTIHAQPAGQTCVVTHGAGIVAAAAVDSVSINCSGPWIWSSGSDKSGAAGVYGTKGVATTGSVPGARGGAVAWTDAAGNLWLFGGTYVDASGKLFFLNDLWRYAPSSGIWTWMSGSSAAAAVYGSPGSYGVRGVAAPSNVPGSRAGAVGWKDAAGTFWLFGGQGYDPSSNLSYLNDLWKYDTATGEWTWVAGPDSSLPPSAVYGTQGVAAPPNLPGPRAGSVSWIDASGNLWLFGGNGDISNASPYMIGLLDDLWEFSPGTGQWTWISGSATVNAAGVYGDMGIPAAANIPTARYGAGSWIDASGNLWLFGGSSFGGFLNERLEIHAEHEPLDVGERQQYAQCAGDLQRHAGHRRGQRSRIQRPRRTDPSRLLERCGREFLDVRWQRDFGATDIRPVQRPVGLLAGIGTMDVDQRIEQRGRSRGIRYLGDRGPRECARRTGRQRCLGRCGGQFLAVRRSKSRRSTGRGRAQ